MKIPKEVRWTGDPPAVCDLCKRPITGVFIDGATTLDGWAVMDEACHDVFGRGVAVGRGQQYERQGDGSWLKTAG